MCDEFTEWLDAVSKESNVLQNYLKKCDVYNRMHMSDIFTTTLTILSGLRRDHLIIWICLWWQF
jgi:hypothetical protein